jgi:hypothetical protein
MCTEHRVHVERVMTECGTMWTTSVRPEPAHTESWQDENFE